MHYIIIFETKTNKNDCDPALYIHQLVIVASFSLVLSKLLLLFCQYPNKYPFRIEQIFRL